MFSTPSDYTYTTNGTGEPVLLLHGLFGGLSNWTAFINRFSASYQTIVPSLPIQNYNGDHAIEFLLDYLEGFISTLQLRNLIIIGNSLGGHLAIRYAVKHPDNMRTLVLTGSSGLFENTMGGSYPKRGSYEYIRERVEYTFHDPATASRELVDEVYKITSDSRKCIGIIKMAKSAQRDNVSPLLSNLRTPTLLIWGCNDRVTPPHVADDFHRMIPDSTLHWIDECGHAPMMEKPTVFNDIVNNYLTK
ncbi:MAG TPA: alpha/beta hydrolase [Chitinophaga sp.]|uniref:alpha/beta fold hydrolase n=1 Tax=Chitinophaga sp. TaxID=1869181 RepID=UPI002C59206F|nr:alpha/beta hydrolase [Chitinophaga sp.]HVI47218.1 alpha/beta hydrolase [Chitinophaga sp.]